MHLSHKKALSAKYVETSYLIRDLGQMCGKYLGLDLINGFEFFSAINNCLNLVSLCLPSKRHQLPRMRRGMKKYAKSFMVVTITHGVPGGEVIS